MKFDFPNVSRIGYKISRADFIINFKFNELLLTNYIQTILTYI